MTVKGRFTTSRITASRVTVGTVLYHGGAVVSVERDGEHVVIYHQWGHMTCLPGARLTYYPRLRRTV